MKKRFKKVNIEISNICNLKCSFCPEVIRSPKLMDTELFRSIIEQVSPLTELVCFHLMGDPLVHPKLEEFVKISAEFDAAVFFVTNGVLLSQKFPEKCKILLQPILHQVNFSLHSYPDNYPQKDPSEYLQRILDFTDLAITTRPDLYINFRLWNLQEVRGANPNNLLMLHKIEKHFNIKVPEIADIRRTKSIRLNGRVYLHYDTEFTWPSLELPRLGNQGTCYGLSSHFGILVDGTVVPCCLDKEAAIPLGNLNEHSISEILERPKTRAILEGFKNNKLVEDLCQRCQYIERFQ